MKNESILAKIKEKYAELENDEDFKKELDERERVIQRFNSLFPKSELLNITLENYDYPKSVDEEKYMNSLTYFIERSKVSIKVGYQKNKMFYYDTKLPEDTEIKYSTRNWIKEMYPNLGIEELFELFKKELDIFVNQFNPQTYTNNWIFLNNYEVIKVQLIRFYYKNTMLGFINNEIYNMVFNALGVSVPNDFDTIQKNLLLIEKLRQIDPDFINSNMEILGTAIYKVFTEEKSNTNQPFNTPLSVNKESIYNNIYQEDSLIDDITLVLSEKKNIILTGTPGVGKTYTINDIIKLMELNKKGKIDNDLESRIKFTQFHQSYGYEEFVEGMTLNNNKLEPKIGIFKSLVDAALSDEDNNYYMIIDEINRGNVSKIFGELLMCIEDDKRSSKYSVTLMYSDPEKEANFYVPNNVYIIGTMNTADRSLTQIDYALRRRFSFFNLKPAYENNKFNSALETCKIKNQIIGTMKYINHVLSKYFGNDNFNIGHSYFAKNPSSIDNQKFERILKYDILPLLIEYMSDLDETDFVKKFKSDYLEYEIFNKLLSEMENKNGN